MRIGIFVYFIPEGKSGGVQQYCQQLVYALSKYSADEVKVFCSAANKHLFEKYVSKNVSLVVLPKKCKYLRGLVNNKVIRKNSVFFSAWQVLVKTKVVEMLLAILGDYKHSMEQQVDVVHFPYQALDRYDLNIPTIISLHDLQHKYYPEFFSSTEIQERDRNFKLSAERCTRIIVSFEHVKKDIVHFYNISAGKIDICGFGYDKKTAVDTTLFTELQKTYGFPDEYLMYPAITWKHKNHIGLANALKLVHEKYGKKIALVCTGAKNDFYATVAAVIKELGMEQYIIFTGYLPEGGFEVLLQQAKLVVVPTLYESESQPLIEAMAFSVPVICSNVTSLPEQIGNDKFVFDPHNYNEMAEKIYGMVTNEVLRQENRQNSARQMEDLAWPKKVTNFVESYQKAIGK